MEIWNMQICLTPPQLLLGCTGTPETYAGILQYNVGPNGKMTGTCTIPEYYPEPMPVNGFCCSGSTLTVLRFVCEGLPGRIKPDFYASMTPVGTDFMLTGGCHLPPSGAKQFDPGDEGSWTASHQ